MGPAKPGFEGKMRRRGIEKIYYYYIHYGKL